MNHDGIVSRLTLSVLATCLVTGPSFARAQGAAEVLPDLASTVAFEFRSVDLTGSVEKQRIYGDSKQFFTEPRTGGSNYPNPLDVFSPSSIGNAVLNGIFNSDKEFEVEAFRRTEIAPRNVSETQFRCAELQKRNFVASLATLEASESGQRLAQDLQRAVRSRQSASERSSDYGVTVVVEDRSALSAWTPSRGYKTYEKQLIRDEKSVLDKHSSASSYYQGNGRRAYKFIGLAPAPSVRIGQYRGHYLVIQATVNPQATSAASQCEVVSTEALAQLWQTVAGFNTQYGRDTYFGGSLK